MSLLALFGMFHRNLHVPPCEICEWAVLEVLIPKRNVRTASWSSEDPTMSPKVITAIVLILQSCRASLDSELPDFILHYLGDYQDTALSPQVQTHVAEASNSGTLWMHFHLRCFGKVQNLGRESNSPEMGPEVVCRRSKATDLGIRERRRSLALLCPFGKDEAEPETTGNYVILRLLDDGWHAIDFRHDETSSSLPLCKPWTGITMFQRMIWGEIDWWETNWRGVLDTIDNLVAFEVGFHGHYAHFPEWEMLISRLQQISDVLNAKSRGRLMYDDHNLNRSETYFTVEQLLRIFEEWTSDPEDDIHTLLHQTAYEMKSRVKSREPEVQSIIESNWNELLSHAQASRNKIIVLIERKRNEIHSLRDGVR